MARKPQPTALKKAAGNPGKRALNSNEPKVTARGTLDKPGAHIKKEALKMWKYLVSVMPPGLLTGADVVELEIFCQAYSLYKEAQSEIVKQGLIILSPEKGIPMQSPFVSIANRQAEIMMRSGGSLGLNPSARSKLQVDGPPANNAFLEFD